MVHDKQLPAEDRASTRLVKVLVQDPSSVPLSILVDDSSLTSLSLHSSHSKLLRYSTMKAINISIVMCSNRSFYQYIFDPEFTDVFYQIQDVFQ